MNKINEYDLYDNGAKVLSKVSAKDIAAYTGVATQYVSVYANNNWKYLKRYQIRKIAEYKPIAKIKEVPAVAEQEETIPAYKGAYTDEAFLTRFGSVELLSAVRHLNLLYGSAAARCVRCTSGVRYLW